MACRLTYSLLRFSILVFSYLHYAKCYTVYIKPYEGASCGLSELTGDPCIVWTSVSPTVLVPSTTWVFTPGDYTITTHWLTVTSIGNFSLIGDPTARLVCTDTANYVGAFRLTSITNVRINNLQFIDCSGNTIRHVPSFVLTNSIFSYNRPFYNRNGLEMEYSTAIIDNTSFDGVIAHISVSSQSSLTIISSNFTNGYSNSRKYYIGLYYSYHNDGGSINNYNSPREIIIRNSRFINNHAVKRTNDIYSDLSRGGAIFTVGNITIDGCIFDGNNASKGGAVYGGGRITVINSNFTQNTGPEGYGHFGGAIYGISAIETINSTFYSNQARKGGAVYSENSVILSVNSTYMYNVANEGNGGALYGGSGVTMVNSSFVKNGALGGTGGAVYVDATHANVLSSRSTFTDNNATSCGVLNVSAPRESNVTMIGSSFSFNRASGIINGGGVACIANAVFTATKCNFTGNVANANAGVLSVKNSSIDIEDSFFIKNIVNANGGVLYTNEYQTNYTIRRSTFNKNMASNGAVMYALSTSNVKVNESMYTENHASNQGGVFYIRGATLVIDMDSTFRHNTANSSGGVISACFSQVTAYGLEWQADPIHPQFCSVYDEGVAVTHAATTVTDATSTTTKNVATTGEASVSTTPNPLTSLSPVTTASTHQGDTSSTTHTKATVSTNHLQTIPSSDTPETATHPVEFTHKSTTSKAPTTWLEERSDTTTSAVDVESTTSATSSIINQKPTTDKGLITTTVTSETTTISVTKEDTANSPMHIFETTTAQTESQTKAESRDQNGDHTYYNYATVSLVVSLISMATSVMICILVLLIVRKVYQKGSSLQYYMLNKRKLRTNEEDTVEVSEVSESPTRSLSEEKDTLIRREEQELSNSKV